ncbi:MAG: ATP-binding protein [Clostridia bacterium]|nr:ATP-binding protein [Clostridia bacterium]MBR5797937.1 ATP-binding protein [Clostridia bacterium]
MVKLIIGIKGTGKTKTLIQMVNSALETTGGNVVVLEKGEKLRYDIKYQARLVNTDEYYVNDAQSLYGFVAGLLASNHDVTELFIDSALKICAEDLPAFEKLVEELDVLTVKRDVNITITASMPEESATDVIKKYL